MNAYLLVKLPYNFVVVNILRRSGIIRVSNPIPLQPVILQDFHSFFLIFKDIFIKC